MKTGKVCRRPGRKEGVVAACALLLLVFIAGCAGPRAGLDRSQQVFDDYSAGRVLDGHVYYTTGPEQAPDAILGVSRDYTLVSERWKERQVDPPSLLRLVKNMDREFGSPTGGLVGARVLNAEGGQIGVWYSAIALTTVEMLGDGKVRIDPPNPAAVMQLRDRSSK
jgi:hypothetical protein